VHAPVQAPATVPATRAADPTRTSVRAATTTAAGTIGRAGVGGGGPATKAAAQNIQGITATRLDLHSPGENLPQRKAQANSVSGGPGLTVPDPNAGYHFVVPQCVAPQRCHDPSASAARPDAPAAGGRPAPAAQPAAPASPELFENPCDTTGGGVAPLASSCRPVTPDQTCWQSGNRYTDRYDETQARICAQGGSAGGPAGGALESCTPNSFDGDTAVLMADGTRKRIRDVRVGDRVLATDPVTGRTEARTVTALIVGQGLKHLVAVSVDTGHGSAALTATDHHPFWDDVDHAWVDADDLTSADTLRTPTGSHIRITATREYDRTQTVYNLTVDTLHTYYVLAGTTPVLVHNANSCTSGDNPPAQNGRWAHSEFSKVLDGLGEVGYGKEFALPSGLRPDGIYTDPATGQSVPVELKPDTRAQIRRGTRELARYEQEMQVPVGSGQLWVYRISQGGKISYRRVR
uniref:polymorphic toxin-type HINT domain-containing protein n=2 Tax=Frankia gtarii TaxID=2950102 RepID=UPI0021C19431